MSTIRINAELRDGIIANALTQRFAADRLQIAEQEEKLHQLTKARDQAGYEAAFSEIDRKRLQAAPEGWFPKSSSVKVAVEDTNEVIQISFAEAQRVPYEVHDNRHGTHIASIIKPDHPYMAARNAVRDAKAIKEAMEKDVQERERALRAKVKAVIESVTTVGRLVEVWPEVQDFLPEVMAGPKGNLPATLISDLNAELGIVREAA
jgi:hypothetical protein